MGWEHPLDKGTATHSSILAWRIPWREEPGRLQSIGSQKVRPTEWLSTHRFYSSVDSPPCSSVHGIFQTRVLEWGAISFSRGSSQPRDRTQVSRIVSKTLYLLRHQGSLFHKLKLHLQWKLYIYIYIYIYISIYLFVYKAIYISVYICLYISGWIDIYLDSISLYMQCMYSDIIYFYTPI